MGATLYAPAEAGLQDPQALARAILALTGQGPGASGSFHLKLPVGFALADAAVLYTVPTGLRLSLDRVYWEVITSWSGGTNSAIGVSSSNAAYNTKGNLLGGAGGDIAAGLVSTGSPFKGTIGAKMIYSAGTTSCVVLVAADTVRFDRVVDIFTAGAGFVHIEGTLID